MRETSLAGPRAFLAATVVLVLSACAYSIPEVSPADVPQLRRVLAADPENTDVQVQLGMALFKDEDFEASRTALKSAPVRWAF